MDINIMLYVAQFLCVTFLGFSFFHKEEKNSIIYQLIVQAFVGYLIYYTKLHILWIGWGYYFYEIWKKYHNFILLENKHKEDVLSKRRRNHLEGLEKKLLHARMERLRCVAGVKETKENNYEPYKHLYPKITHDILELEDEVYAFRGYPDAVFEEYGNDAYQYQRELFTQRFVVDKLRKLECHKRGVKIDEVNFLFCEYASFDNYGEFDTVTDTYLDENETLRDVYISDVVNVIDKIEENRNIRAKILESSNHPEGGDYSKMYDESLLELNTLLYGDKDNPPPEEYNSLNSNGSEYLEKYSRVCDHNWEELLGNLKERIDNNGEEE